MRYSDNKKYVRIALGILVIVIIYYVITSVTGGKQRSIAGIPDPKQTKTTGGITIERSGYSATLNFLYEYDIEALVVSTKKYSGRSFADALSPLDVALAWGPAAQYNVECNINWSQSGRWYYWKCADSSAFDKAGGSTGISNHSANNHLIPADSSVKNKIMKIKVGDHIRIKGYLVNIDGSKGDNTYYWYSSVSREDEGDGACEVIYVKEVEWLD